MEDFMEEYRQELIRKCDLGIRGGYRKDVKVINMWLTNKCNINCIMCPFVLKEYENKTYFNEAPFFATLKDVERILPRHTLFSKKIEKETEIEFNFFKGETLLNPEAMDIFKYIKRRYKKSKIAVLSNGTIPPLNVEIVKYIDVLGFSLDGGTKEVFESIRTPANFEHVIGTIKEWIKVQKIYNPDLLLRTSTTLSKMNIEDLPNIVETVGEAINEVGGRWDSIYCQPVVIEDYQSVELKKITLEHVPLETGRDILKETEKVAIKYNIRLDIPQSIYEMFGYNSKSESVNINEEKKQEPEVLKEAFCDKLSNGYLSYDLNGRVGFACCFMDKKYWRDLIERYNIPDYKNPDIIYNSKGYWQLRKDLLEGKLQKECRNCTIGKSNYYKLRTKLLEESIMKK